MVDWNEIREKLPTARTEQEKQKRKELFQAFDPNNNGYLSLAEVDKGCRDVLGLYELFEAKKVIMRAYQAARTANDGKNQSGTDYIEPCEFRLLLVYLRRYFELWQMFKAVDTTADCRVSFDEFKTALPKIEAWGLEIKDPESEFKEVDKNEGGMLLFDEFADWALRKSLDLEESDE